MNLLCLDDCWREQEGPTSFTRWRLLRELGAAFSKLDLCIAELDLATAAAQPDMAKLSAARFKISVASNVRRILVEEACRQLLAASKPHRADAIRALQREAAAYGRASTEHIGCWAPAAIMTDWPAYQGSSRAIRAKMKHGIHVEQHLLLPLLRGDRQ